MTRHRNLTLGLALSVGLLAGPASALTQPAQPTAAEPRDGSHDFDDWFGT
ncbi:MAG: hypothetical protein JWO52_5343 [Gammaproteobacteria bacterium]|nr:hypothetical protein [Gammaproteobacteria bacterium]